MESGQVDDSIKEQITQQCIHSSEFIREAVVMFQRLHLNMAWYSRLMENREMIAGQLDALSYAMENCIAREHCMNQVEKGRLLKIQYHLKEYGIRAKHLHYYYRENGTSRITIELNARWGNCIFVKEALQVLNRYGTEEMIPIESNRNFIGKDRYQYEFVTRPILQCSHGVARLMQEGQEISGDNFSVLQREDGKVMLALSNGMGTGLSANKESETVIELMEQFVEAGFSMDIALRLMNAAMVFGGEEDHYSTLDLCLLDVYTGIAEFYKVGAHVSYIKHKDKVEVIADETLPVGAEITIDVNPWRNHVECGDFLVMVTDGVLEYLHVFNPVETIRDIISCIECQEPEQFAMRILERVLLYTGGRIMDDMTVLVVSTQER